MFIPNFNVCTAAAVGVNKQNASTIYIPIGMDKPVGFVVVELLAITAEAELTEE